MVRSAAGHYNDQTACCLLCAASHSSVHIMDLVIADHYVGKCSCIFVLHNKSG